MKTQHKILSLLLSICVIFGMSPTMVFAQNLTVEDVWTDHAAASFAGGQGTEIDPYQIATAEQLAKLAQDVNSGTEYEGKYFKLTNHIDLSDYIWPGIGCYKHSGVNKAFRGFLDGNNLTIRNLTINENENTSSFGLFGNIRKMNESSPNDDKYDVGVKNLTISNANINANQKEYAGILVGFAMANPNDQIQFENISVSGVIHTDNVYAIVGGMIGYGDRVTVNNCKAENVSITGSGNSGGFVGMSGGSTFTNCTASGTINGSWTLGGFVGYSYSAGMDSTEQSIFEKCIADVNVEGNDWRLGGFVGFSEYGKYTNCIALGDVSSSVDEWNPKVGGFIGESGNDEEGEVPPTVEDCHAAGTVTSASSDYQAGGFVGHYTDGSYSDCSFDQQKNPDLSAIGKSSADEGDIPSIIVGADSETVLGQLCEDFYNGHDYASEWTIDVEPTCTQEGSKSHHCTRCGKKNDITAIPKADHTYTWVIDKEPTKDHAGSKYQYCVNCHHKTNYVSIPAIGYTEKVENAVYRAYNPNNGEHLYTTDYDEFIHITNNGWQDEGVAFMAEEEKNGQALYRVYNPNSGLHHYTLNENEKNTLVSLGWHDEKVAWYTSKKPQSAPVYRVYNPNDGNHHYTMNKQEKDVLVSLGWHDEGLAFRTSPLATK